MLLASGCCFPASWAVPGEAVVPWARSAAASVAAHHPPCLNASPPPHNNDLLFSHLHLIHEHHFLFQHLLVRGVAAAAADVAGVVTLRATPPPALSPPFLLRPSSLLCERQVLLLMSLSVLRTPAIQKWCVSKIRSACCRCREAVSASGLGHAMVRVLFALSFLVSSSCHFLRDVCIDLEHQFLLYPLEFVAGDLPVGYITVGRLGHWRDHRNVR